VEILVANGAASAVRDEMFGKSIEKLERTVSEFANLVGTIRRHSPAFGIPKTTQPIPREDK
jgi:hypothetical protein